MKKFTFLICLLASSLFIMADVPSVIISQVYGGGGNSGATYKSDFIELYNTTAVDIDISGWSLQYASATNIVDQISSNINVFPVGSIVKAHSHYSIKCADGNNGEAWPAGTFDWEPSANILSLSGSAGKVILMKNGTGITPATLNAIIDNPNFGDYVPFGTTAVPVYGSAMASNPSNAQSVLRKFVDGAYQYTGNIGNDFELATPNPRKTPTDAGQVATPIISPSGGTITAPVTVSISSTTEDAVIYYTIDGNTPTTASDVYSVPFVVSTTTTVKAIATKATFTDSEVATATYTFPSTVANIAAFNALSAGDVATITGEVTVVYQNGSNLFVQDASGWLIVYGSTTKTFVSGDRITGLSGTFAMYQNAPELVLIGGAIPDGIAGDPAEAYAIDPANLTDPDDINRYVEFSDVVVAADFTYSTSAASDGSIVVGAGTMTVRNHYSLCSGTYTAGTHVKIKGIVKTYQSAFNIYVLSIENATSTQEQLQVNNIDVFAQDGKITVNTTDVIQKIEVYDITGRMLLKTTDNTFSVDNKGMILVRIKTDRTSFFTKVVVK